MGELTDEEFRAATRRGAELEDRVLARSVRYDPQRRLLQVELRNGASFTFPVDKVQGLAGASDRDLADVEISGGGYGLHWEKLDADLTVGGLSEGIFGTARYMAQQAGRTKSEAKAVIARRSRSDGARPRKAVK